VPRRARGLRAAAVRLKAGAVMDWHSTHGREELLITLSGRVRMDIQSTPRRVTPVMLKAGRCALLPKRTLHRVVNRSKTEARYIYVSAIA